MNRTLDMNTVNKARKAKREWELLQEKQKKELAAKEKLEKTLKENSESRQFRKSPKAS